MQDSDGDEEGADDAAGKDDTEMNIDIRTSLDVDAGDESMVEGLSVQEVDAYWLQRWVTKAFGTIDASASQKLAEEVFEAMQVKWMEWVGEWRVPSGRCRLQENCCQSA